MKVHTVIIKVIGPIIQYLLLSLYILFIAVIKVFIQKKKIFLYYNL